MTAPFPDFLASKRLTLRRLDRNDAGALCAYRSLPEVARYQSWEFFGPDDATTLINSQSGHEPGIGGTWFQLAIVETSTNRMIGDCGIHCIQSDSRLFELGITLAPEAQGRGYAIETIGRLLVYIFLELDGRCISATTDVLNEPAAALFRRLGFQQSDPSRVLFKGQWGNEFAFTLSKDSWEQRCAEPIP
jgi:RimJ/RimL family protein N-acetyltransferase